MSKRTKGFGGITLALLVAMVIGYLAGQTLEGRVMAQSTTDELRIFSEVLAHIQNKYVEEVDVKELIEGAVQGMVQTLDPHSSFMKKQSYQELKVDTKGEFGGLGIQISIRDHRLVVISPIEDTPAFAAGIKSGDHIFKVDGDPTKDMTVMESVEKMRGKRGTDVVLTIVRKGEDEPFDVTITRDIIKLKSVRGKMVEPGIGYIRVTQFQERSGPDVKKKLDDLLEEGLDGLILDLRNNPGGLLTAAVEISELFLEDGQMVVYIQGRDGDRDEYYAHSPYRDSKFPVVVLVNQGSASASEIVSGALQDLGRAVILGTVTFGKGSVQSILPLSDESGLRLTTAKYYTPSGRSIQNTGITPDILVAYDPDYGVPVGRKHALVREEDLDGHLGNSTVDETQKSDAKDGAAKDSDEPKIGAKGEDEASQLTPDQERYLKDNQLQDAVDLLKGWRILQGKSSMIMTAEG